MKLTTLDYYGCITKSNKLYYNLKNNVRFNSYHQDGNGFKLINYPGFSFTVSYIGWHEFTHITVTICPKADGNLPSDNRPISTDFPNGEPQTIILSLTNIKTISNKELGYDIIKCFNNINDIIDEIINLANLFPPPKLINNCIT